MEATEPILSPSSTENKLCRGKVAGEYSKKEKDKINKVAREAVARRFLGVDKAKVAKLKNLAAKAEILSLTFNVKLLSIYLLAGEGRLFLKRVLCGQIGRRFHFLGGHSGYGRRWGGNR